MEALTKHCVRNGKIMPRQTPAFLYSGISYIAPYRVNSSAQNFTIKVLFCQWV